MSAALNSPTSGQESANLGRQRALLLGCCEYPALAEAFPDRYEEEIRLRGPENDVRLMHATLTDVLGFEKEDIVELAFSNSRASNSRTPRSPPLPRSDRTWRRAAIEYFIEISKGMDRSLSDYQVGRNTAICGAGSFLGDCEATRT